MFKQRVCIDNIISVIQWSLFVNSLLKLFNYFVVVIMFLFFVGISISFSTTVLFFLRSWYLFTYRCYRLRFRLNLLDFSIPLGSLSCFFFRHPEVLFICLQHPVFLIAFTHFIINLCLIIPELLRYILHTKSDLRWVRNTININWFTWITYMKKKYNFSDRTNVYK